LPISGGGRIGTKSGKTGVVDAGVKVRATAVRVVFWLVV
jgi:hypothetical protein